MIKKHLTILVTSLFLVTMMTGYACASLSRSSLNEKTLLKANRIEKASRTPNETNLTRASTILRNKGSVSYIRANALSPYKNPSFSTRAYANQNLNRSTKQSIQSFNQAVQYESLKQGLVARASLFDSARSSIAAQPKSNQSAFSRAASNYLNHK